MAATSFKRFSKSLKKSESTVFLFNGDENFLKDEGVDAVLKKFSGTYDEDFDIVQFSGTDTKAPELIGELNASPMLSEKRIVIVFGVDKTPVKVKNALRKWLDHPSENVVAIFTTYERVSVQKVKLFEKFSKVGTAVNCYKFEYDDMFGWIKEAVSKLKKDIENVAIEYMIDMVGFDLYKMKNEIKKLSLLTIGQDVITVNDVSKVVSDIRSDSVFDMVDLIVKKDAKRVMRMVSNVIKDRSDQGILLVALIMRQVKNVSMFLSLSERGVPEQGIAQKIGINPYFLRGIREQARFVSMDDVFGIFNKLLYVDMQLKGSPLSPNAVIESLIMEICGQEA